MVTWLVTGGSGMLAQQLSASLRGEVRAPSRAELDITDVDAVDAALEGVDIVVNAPAYTRVDDAEQHEDEALAVNAVAAGRLAAAAHVRGVRRTRADREASIELLMTHAKFSRPHAERLYADALPTFDERGDLPPRAMTAFWGMLTAAGEVPEPWAEARFLDRRFIDTFADWVPPR